MAIVKNEVEIAPCSSNDSNNKNNNNSNSHNNSHDHTNHTNSAFDYAGVPWRYKVMVLVTTVFFSAGSHYGAAIFSPLKSTLKREMNLDNTQISILASTVSLINTVIPFFGGLALDTLGTTSGAIMSTIFVLLGSTVASVAAVANNYGLMVLSRVVFGLGTSYVIIVQEVILAHWFHGTGLGAAIGAQIAVSRLFDWMATATAIRIRDATSHFSAVFWVAAGICGYSFLTVLAYMLVIRRAKAHFIKSTNTQAIANIAHLPDAFWVTPLIGFIMSAIWSPFGFTVVEAIEVSWNTAAVAAAQATSNSLAITIVLTPIVGILIDRIGRRGAFTFVSAILAVVSLSLLTYTWVRPIVGLMIFSVSVVFGTVSLASSVALVVPRKYLGAAIGIKKVFMSVGVALFDVATGLVQDGTPGGGYERVSLMFLVLACVSVVVAALYWIVDYWKLDGVQNAGHRTRRAILEKRHDMFKQEEESRRNGTTPKPRTFGLPLRPLQVAVYVAAFILLWTAWITYFIFLFNH
ncbi:MFS general substrate transporter [Ramicandelaber brevisporus]|nr:MFS general substrate transporter [Ramicandelaber brevisporus]